MGLLVRVVGFEPTTSCARGRRATKLRYTLKKFSSQHGEGGSNPYKADLEAAALPLELSPYSLARPTSGPAKRFVVHS